MSSTSSEPLSSFHQVPDVVRHIFNFLFIDTVLSGPAGVCKAWNELVFDGQFIYEHRKLASQFLQPTHKDPKRFAFDWIELISNKYPDVYETLLKMQHGITDISFAEDKNAGVQISLLANNEKPVKLYVARMTDSDLRIRAYVNDSCEIVEKSESTMFFMAELHTENSNGEYYFHQEPRVNQLERCKSDYLPRWSTNYDEWLADKFSEYLEVVPPGIFWSIIEALAVSFTRAECLVSASGYWMFHAKESIANRFLGDQKAMEMVKTAQRRFEWLNDPHDRFRQAVEEGAAAIASKLLIYDYGLLTETEINNVFENSINQRWNGDMVRFLLDYGMQRFESLTAYIEKYLPRILLNGPVDVLRALHEYCVQLPTELYLTDNEGDHPDFEILDFLKEVNPDFYCPYDRRRSSDEQKVIQKVLFLYHDVETKKALHPLLERYSTGQDDSKRTTLQYSFQVIPETPNKPSTEQVRTLGVDKYDIVFYVQQLPGTSVSVSVLEVAAKAIQELTQLCPSVVYAYSLSRANFSAEVRIPALNRKLAKVFQGLSQYKLLYISELSLKRNWSKKLDDLLFGVTETL